MLTSKACFVSLAGSTGTLVCWSLMLSRLETQQQQQQEQQQQQQQQSGGGDPSLPGTLNPLLLAATAGSYVTRFASYRAYQGLGRSMVAGDLIPHLKEAVDCLGALGSAREKSAL
jgi:NAD(P)H-hydrate repair Nnr-like enzyme with NAD(P)H-hydrate dehydratase domain